MFEGYTLREKLVKYVIIIAVFWSLIITTFSQEIASLTPFNQFMLITFVSYLLPSILLGTYLNESMLKKTIGSLLFLMAFDLIIPPLIVGLDGAVNTSAFLSSGSIDAFVAGIWQSAVNAQGIILFLLTYPVTFIILITLSTYLLTERQLWDIIRKV